MKILLLAAVLITLPALAALIWSIMTGHTLIMYAAMASFGLNTLPFLAAYFLTLGHSGDVGH